jgi:hypothetical protein
MKHVADDSVDNGVNSTIEYYLHHVNPLNNNDLRFSSITNAEVTSSQLLEMGAKKIERTGQPGLAGILHTAVTDIIAGFGKLI